MNDDPITVAPVNGLGWFDGAQALTQIPAAFDVNIRTSAEKVWNGTVVSIGHPFQGSTVELFQRHSEWSGHVDIVVRQPSSETVTTGYGVLDQQPPSKTRTRG